MTHGFSNDTVYCSNLDFRGVSPPAPQMVTDGQLLFGRTGGNPGVALPTADNGLTYTGSAAGGTWGLNLSNCDTGTLPVTQGGTGLSGATVNEIYYASATDTMAQITAAADSTLVTDGSNVPTLSQTLPSAVQGNITAVGTIASGTWNGDTITVPYGGTGATSVTAYNVVCGGTTDTGALQPVGSLGTAGQVLTSAGAGALPTWSNNVSISWEEYSSTPQTASVNMGYYCSLAGTVVITLPVTSAQFSVITIQANDQAASFQIAQNANQQILMLDGTPTTVGVGGTLTCAQAGSRVTLLCVVADLTWRVINVMGNVTLA